MGYSSNQKIKLKERWSQHSRYSISQELSLYLFRRSLQNTVLNACADEIAHQNHVRSSIYQIWQQKDIFKCHWRIRY